VSENVGSPAEGSWVTEAIAEQEEHIKRWKSCDEVVGRAHRFEMFRGPDSKLPVPDEVTWRQCVNCDVTETREDYATKLRMQNQPVSAPPAPEELQAVSQPDRYAALAARYRQALVQALRQTANPTTAGQLERVTVMDPERDRLAWRIHDMADPRALGVAHRAATGLPSVWSGEMELEELEGLVQELEDLYLPKTSA